MGFRLYVYKAGDKDSGKGDRYAHKFYGYVHYQDVVDSFTYLYTVCHNQSYPFKDEDRIIKGKKLLYVDEVYHIFNKRGIVGPFTMNAAQFRHFKDLYLIDIYKRAYLDRSFFKGLCNYMDDLSELGGDKCLMWK